MRLSCRVAVLYAQVEMAPNLQENVKMRGKANIFAKKN